MEKLQLPFNATKMNEEDAQKILEKLNLGGFGASPEVSYEEKKPKKLQTTATKMNKEDAQNFVERLNSEDCEVLLEVRDKKNKLKGFQTVLPIDKWEKLMKAYLDYLHTLTFELPRVARSERKFIREKIEATRNNIEQIRKMKVFIMQDSSDIKREIEMLDSYVEGETALDFAPLETTNIRIR